MKMCEKHWEELCGKIRDCGLEDECEKELAKKKS